MFKPALIAAAALALAPQFAWAHAHLKQAAPADKAVVATAPASVTASFSEGLEPAFSSLTLLDAAGKPAATAKAAPAPGDDKTLVLPVPKDLPAGAYTVKWQALSKDGHKTDGAWTFTVKP